MSRAPAWIPWPLRVEELGGPPLRIAPAARVVAGEPELAALAALVAGEIERACGARLAVAVGGGGAGDVVLRTGDAPPAGYRLRVGDAAVVEAPDRAGLAAGTVTLLQALEDRGGPVLPRVAVEDAPRFSHRAVMLDCARQPLSVDTLRCVVRMCRFYRINYLQLHLTDDEAFVFPSEAFSRVGTPGRCYARGQLEELERFARDRGVALVPELDVPGHAAALVAALPELFGLAGGERDRSLVNIGRERVYEALERLVGELCAVFRSTPYVHVGGDEVRLDPLARDPEARAYMAAHDLRDPHELFHHFLVRMHEIVGRQGKQTLVWEGFGRGGRIAVPKDVVVLVWDTGWQRPDELLAAGHRVVNASWQPLYVVGPHGPRGESRMWSPEHLYGWDPHRWEHFEPGRPSSAGLEIAPDDGLIGAQMCVWEQPEAAVVPDLRARLPAVAERTWNPGPGRDLADFEDRARRADALLARLL